MPQHAARAVALAGDGGGSPDTGRRARLDLVRTEGAAADGHGERREGCRIVIADDAEAVRVLLRALLSLEPDFVVVGEAENGLQAIDLVVERDPDLLLLDLSMPVLDGLETLEQLRASHPELRIVVYTGHTSPEIERSATELGAHDVVLKGSLPDELILRLRRAADLP